MLKSKIHRARVTDCDLHYVGSITIDPDLYAAHDRHEMPEYEPRVVHVDTRNQILAIDERVATLLTPTSDPMATVPVA